MSELYTCKYCGDEIDWEGSSMTGATIWSCEELGCGETFCSDCFRKRYNNAYSNMDEFTRMTNYADEIFCLDHYQTYLENLWLELEDAPINLKTEVLESDWYGFPEGTDREDILHWFDKMYGKGVIELANMDEVK